MAAELVAGALLSALLDVLKEKLASHVFRNFFSHDQSVEKLVEKLNDTLLSANKLLNDAEDKQVTDSLIKNWVDELNRLLSEAEHVVDKINTEALQRKLNEQPSQAEHVQPGNPKKRKFSSLTSLIPSSFNAFDREIKQEIVNITERLDRHLTQKDSIGLKEGVESKWLLKRAYDPLIVNSSDVYGRDDDIKAIMKSIDDDKISVIPIVGMGGVGKTTLARLVYDDNSVKHRFELRAWVTVSDDFDVFKLAKQALEGFTGVNSKVKEQESLKRELEKILRGKKFLLVLDDVWTEDYALWKNLKSCFQFGAEGSKIIVTTRNERIGSMMGSVPAHRLNTMSDEDCWQLFKKHAFHNIEPNVCRDLEEIGRAIVKKCGGLPLAMMSLAGLLCSVSDPKEWEAVLKSDVWELHKNDNVKILPSLWLSYSYLPSQFKRCFSYCSIFPKDYNYNKKKIILLWMAEGLLQGENMEDDGEKCFKTLISRSLFQRSAQNELSLFQRSAQNESSVVMHDLVHDLATFVSGKDFCIRLNDEDNGLRNLTDNTRHLLYEKKSLEPKDFEGLSEENCVRSFISLSWLIIDEANLDALLKKLQRLRVLCLSSQQIKKVTKSIGKLKHLRYLDLSYTKINSIPDEVCSLYNLQTLLLNGCRELTELPANMGRLLNLRHLDLSRCHQLTELPANMGSLPNLRHLDLSGCGKLTELPANMGSLLNLRHLDLSDNIEIKRLPDAVCSLDNLQTLLLNGCWSLTELPANMGSLLNLRHLDLSNNTVIKRLPDAVCSLDNLQTLLLNGCWSLTELPANMGSLLNLRHLDLSGTDSLQRMPLSNWNLKGLRTLTKLVLNDEHSGSKIKELKELSDGSFEIEGLENVVNPKDVLEAEFEKKSGITEITLAWSRSSVEKDRATLDAFKPHVSLKKLNIINYGGTKLSDWVGDGSLTNLQFLDISYMKELQRWSLEGVAFRCLQELRLYSCRQMEVLSCGQMNTTFPSLVKLEIGGCPKLEITGLPLPSSLEKLCIRNCEKLMAQRMQWGLLTTSLKELTTSLSGCEDLIDTFPEEGLLPTTLRELWIWDAPNMKALNGNAFQHLTSLNQLSILNCPKLECLPEQGLPASLTHLTISFCPKLECLPEQGLPASLTHLTISFCPKLECLPEQGLPASLTHLTISFCPKLECLPEQGLPASLNHLSIHNCPKLECLPEQGLPASLTYLSIHGCPKLECLPEQGLPASLTHLTIWFCPKLECLPEQGLPASLNHLSIHNCPKLECLPEQGLPASLTYLSIHGCPKLECLPEQGLPASLTDLSVSGCRQLEARLQRETGQDWHKISHIRRITVNWKDI